MKKSMKKLFTILLVLLFACNVFAAEGVITFVKGKVEVKRGNNWVSLKVGDKVAQSEVINTGFQSEAKVKLMDNVLYLGPVTRVTLSTLSSSDDKDKVNVYLSTGTIRSKVNRTDTKRVSYTVRTPIAVASVRGTELINDGPNNVYCLKGKVAVTNTKRLSLPKKEEKAKDENPEDGDNENSEEPEAGNEPDIEEVINENLDLFGEGDSLPGGEVTITKNQNIEIKDQLGIGGAKNLAEESILNTINKISKESNKEAAESEKPISSNDIIDEEISAPTTGSVLLNIGFADTATDTTGGGADVPSGDVKPTVPDCL